mmetsp:Transcript_10838/g.25125  ORF Transcript_10838/g.25125 Transcript_10838/m.25125 type:complete len:390 (+) Transcript_10838:1145-2314(+)
MTCRPETKMIKRSPGEDHQTGDDVGNGTIRQKNDGEPIPANDSHPSITTDGKEETETIGKNVRDDEQTKVDSIRLDTFQHNDSKKDERPLIYLLFRSLHVLLSSIMDKSPMNDGKHNDLQNVLDLSELEEIVANHLSFAEDKHHHHPITETCTTGYIYEDIQGALEKKNDGEIQIWKDLRMMDRFKEGEKGVLCVILPGTMGDSLEEPHIDCVLRDGVYSLKRRSQCLCLVQFPAGGAPVASLQSLRKEIQVGFYQIFLSHHAIRGTKNAHTHPHSWDRHRIQPLDVLCDSRDDRISGHYGNRQFGLLVDTHMTRYQKDLVLLADAEMRAKVAREIVQTVRMCEPGGRFLAKTKYGTWRDIGDKLAVRYVGLILKKSVKPLKPMMCKGG